MKKVDSRRVLVIVESPNKCKTIKQFLPPNYIVMASYGHIYELKDDKKTYYNTGIDVDNGFKATYGIADDKKEIVKKLKDQVELSDVVYICSDPDREGEDIAWSLKKYLKIPKEKLRRATFHEITKSAVLKALENPRNIDNDLVEAAQARKKGDKELGFVSSTFAKRYIRAKSDGRCQGACMELICKREEQIQNFVPVKYGELVLSFTKDKTQFKAKYQGENDKPISQPSYDFCYNVANDCFDATENNEWFKVTSITSKDRHNSPKQPFITSTFQQEVSSKLGVPIKSAMNYARTLFEGIDIAGEHKALITYIRTDSPEISPEFTKELETFVKEKYGKEYYAPLRKLKKGKNVQDGHECIRPVDLNMTPELIKNYISDARLVKVYKLIYDRTVALMMADSITNETTYKIDCRTHNFAMTSKELTFDGYLKVYDYKDQNEEELVKVTFEEGEVIDKSYRPTLTVDENETKPQPRYKEATLVKKLEDSGIGRPSTFEKIVETAKDASRGFAVVEDGYLVPTDLGMKLYEFNKKYFSEVINENYTSKMEESLDLIASGKMTQEEFLTDFTNKLESSVAKLKQDKPPVAEKVVAEGIVCPLCGSPMYLRQGPYSQFYGCSKYPKCKGVIKK